MTKKYKLLIPPTNIAPGPRLEMPIWYHTGIVGMKNVDFNTAAAKCQKENHKIRMVGDLLDLIKCTNSTLNTHHKPRWNCKYTQCKNLEKAAAKTRTSGD